MITKKQNKNIGLLLRVSSDVQESDGNSLDVQEEMGVELAKRLGFTPVIYNEGSQSTFRVEVTSRLKLVELLDDVKKGIIDKIWVFNTDRLGRESRSWYSIYKTLLESNVKIYVGNYDKPYDLNNPMDTMIIGILTNIAQYDNALRRMRSGLGKRKALRNGQTYVGGTIPFGYRVNEQKKLIIDKKESNALRTIFKMYAKGSSVQNLIVFLDTEGFRPPRGGDGWSTGTIQQWLRNTLYKGVQVWEWKEEVGGVKEIIETIKIKTPRIISDKLFDEVQLQLWRLNRGSNKKKNITIFDGLLYCRSCDTRLLVKQQPKYPDLYSCPSVNYKWKNPNKWGQKHQDCTLKSSARINHTDPMLINHLIDVLKESKKVREEYKGKSLGSRFESDENIRKQVETKTKYILESQRELEILYENLAEVEIDIITRQNLSNAHPTSKSTKQLSSKIKVLKKRIVSQTDFIEETKREIDVLNTSNEWINWLDSMYFEIDSLERLPLEQQKIFIKKYVKKISVEYHPSKHSHRFNFNFLYPIIEDKFDIIGKNKLGRREYKIRDGKSTSSVVLPLPVDRTRKKDETIEELNKIITQSRVDGLSLNEISSKLNSLDLKTTRGNDWNKSRVQSYIRHMKIDVGK